jgi:hypothetical protein
MKKIFCTILLLTGLSGLNFPQSANWVKILDKPYLFDLKCTSNGYLFACSQAIRGIYRSTDLGNTWTADTSFDRYINRIAIDKNDVIYLGTDGSWYSILKSTDLGLTWSVSYVPYFKVTALYANNGFVYAGGSDGKIIRSTDSGLSWDTSNVSNNSITSFTSTKNGRLFVCAYNGPVFTSSDFGTKWTPLSVPQYSGNSIIADSNDYLYMDQYEQVGVSTDYGLTWNLYGHFIYDHPSVTGLDYMSNIYISIGYIYKSSNSGLSWSKIGAPDVVTSIVPYHDIIFISTFGGIYKYDPALPIYVGNNYSPLHLGNMYQYFETSYNHYFTHYNIDTTTINRDTVINNNTYFNYSGWRRYSEADKKIYIFVNSNEQVIMDFNKAVGDTFNQYSDVFKDIRFATVNGGEIKLFSQNYKYKGFNRPDAYQINYHTEYFAENFGSFQSESFTYGSGGGDYYYREIMMAILYDSLGNKHYYSNHRKPQITITPITAIHSNSFSLNFDINHYYNQTSGNPTEGSLNFIDSVVFMSYYQKGDSLITKPDLLVSNPSVGKYQMATTLDTVLMKKGFVFNYRIIAKDKGIIQETASSPDAGYYKCVWDFGQGIENKNNIPAEYMLAQNYPNPFNPNTIISYGLKEKGYVRLMVYNITGELVQELVNERREQGNYEIEFNAKGLASGIYLYRLEVIDKGNIPVYSSMKKMVFLK